MGTRRGEEKWNKVLEMSTMTKRKNSMERFHHGFGQQEDSELLNKLFKIIRKKK